MYQAGSLSRTMRRLSAIQVKAGASLVRQYNLTYDNLGVAGASRLTSVTECDAAGNCLRPHEITLQTISTYNEFSENVNLHGQNGPTSYAGFVSYIGDFNGDGRADGRTDILWGAKLAPNDMRSAGYRDILLSNGDGSFTPVYNVQNQNNAYIGWNPHFGDFNGDGRTDILWDNKLSGVDLRSAGDRNLWLSTGNGTFAITGNFLGQNGGYIGWNPHIADFNGDGKADVLWDFKYSQDVERSAGYRTLWASNASGTYSITANVAGQDGFYLGWGLEVADFNGDGKADILWDDKTGANDPRSAGSRNLWLSMSTDAGPFNIIQNVAGQNGFYGGWVASIGDFNGDGRADILWDYKLSSADLRSGGSRNLWLSTGNQGGGFTVVANVNAMNGSYSGWDSTIADFNGDGKADILWDYQYSGADRRSAGQRHLWTQSAGLADVAGSIQNSLGASASVSYAPLTSAAVYTKDGGTNAAAYPQVDVQAPLYVVSSFSTSDGIGSSRATSLAYGGAKADTAGRGFLGFRWSESVDQATGLKSRTESRQDWPYVGMASLVRRTQGSGALLSEATNTFGCMDPATGAACAIAAGARYFPHVSQSVETANDLNGAPHPPVTTVTQYDLFGNAQSVSVSTADGYSKVTTNMFANDVPNWLLGRLMRSTVQSTAP